MTGLREELERIRDEYGILTPEIIVEEARPAHSSLHDRFEWDNAVAGEAHRRDQAHQLIRSVKIRYLAGEGLHEVRAFHAVRRGHEFDYVPADQVARDPIAKEIVLREMRRQFLELQRRYSHFEEWTELISAAAEQSASV